MKRGGLQWSRTRAGRWTIGGGLALVGYALLGFGLAPAVIRAQLRHRLAALTHRTATIQQVRLNPFTLSLTIRGLDLREPNGELVASCAELSGTLRLAALGQRAWLFREITLNRPVVHLVRQPDGTFNLANLGTTAPPAPAGPPPARPAGRGFAAERLRVTDGVLDFQDVPRRSLVTLDRINGTMAGLALSTNGPVATVVSWRCNGTGTVAVQGTVWLFTHAGDLRLQVTNLDLRALQPYVAEIWKVQLTGGTLTAQGRARYAADGGGAPQFQFVGQLGVAQLAAVDPATRAELFRLESLGLSGLDLRYQPHGLDLAAVDVVGLRSRIAIQPDKTSNWKGLLRDAEKLHALIVDLQLNRLFPFQIGAVSLTRGALGFTDRSLEPTVVAELQEITGRVTGLSSVRAATAHVDLHGQLNGSSAWAITGTINPLADDLKLDLALSLKNGELSPGSPYAAKYAGYPIRAGQLTIAAHYIVDQQTLQAENTITLQQLQLGAKTDSPSATQLPVKLAIALLQDRHGDLTFTVPVNGRLDDPQFRVGLVVTQVLLGLVTKAVSNPFALLGSLFGGGDELQFVRFEPGGADFAAGQTRKLDTLAQALAAHPALELAISGAVSLTQDRDALVTAKLHQQLQAGRIAPGREIPPPDYARLLAPLPVAALSSNAVSHPGATDPEAPSQNFAPRQLPSAGAASAQLFTDRAARILATIQITPADWQVLRQARADKVRSYLLATGQVAAAQLVIVAPPAVDPSNQGQSRAELSLQ